MVSAGASVFGAVLGTETGGTVVTAGVLGVVGVVVAGGARGVVEAAVGL